MLTLANLIEAHAKALQLKLVNEAALQGSERFYNASLAAANTAAADLIGHLNLIHPDRIQVIGAPEMAFFSKLSLSRQAHYLDDFFTGGAPAIIMAEGLSAPPKLLEACNQHQTAVVSTPLNAAMVIDHLRNYLTRKLAEVLSRHGVFMDVLGTGVLITGESGLGKSELALELISRGHGLVADDVVDFYRSSPNSIEGRCPELLRNMLEVRGLGLLDIKAIFGETAVRRRMRLKLVVHLIKRTQMDEYERLPLEQQSETLFGIAVRKVVLPVAAGRSLAVLLEAAVRNTILQLRGIDTTAEFLRRQVELMEKN